jgi:hypothetical protein
MTDQSVIIVRQKDNRDEMPCQLIFGIRAKLPAGGAADGEDSGMATKMGRARFFA